MRRTLTSLALGAMLFALGFPAEAQQPKKVYRIGYLSGSDAATDAPRFEGIQLALRELGYVEGQNIVIEYRYADGKLDQLPQFAAELVRLNVAVIVTTGSPPTRAAQQATKTIPVVMTVVGDPLEGGFVASLAQPGGNITGLTQMHRQLSGKRLGC